MIKMEVRNGNGKDWIRWRRHPRKNAVEESAYAREAPEQNGNAYGNGDVDKSASSEGNVHAKAQTQISTTEKNAGKNALTTRFA